MEVAGGAFGGGDGLMQLHLWTRLGTHASTQSLTTGAWRRPSQPRRCATAGRRKGGGWFGIKVKQRSAAGVLPAIRLQPTKDLRSTGRRKRWMHSALVPIPSYLGTMAGRGGCRITGRRGHQPRRSGPRPPAAADPGRGGHPPPAAAAAAVAIGFSAALCCLLASGRGRCDHGCSGGGSANSRCSNAAAAADGAAQGGCWLPGWLLR